MARRGFRFPPIRSAAVVMTATFAIASVVSALLPALGSALVLWPNRVVAAPMPWQVVTYLFVATSPVAVIFGCLIVYQLGSALEAMWGRRRFITICLGIGTAAAVLTVLLSYLAPQLVNLVYPGGVVLTSTLWVLFGLSYGSTQIGFWGVPIRGDVFALLGAAFVVLSAAFSGLASVIPELVALGLAWAVMRWRIGPWTRFRSWQLNRSLRRNSPHLVVVRKPRGQDYLN